MPTIALETVIGAPIEDCFILSLSVDAHAASMDGSGERAVAGVTSGIMTLHDTVTWRARHFGLPFRMTSVISAYEPPARFVDEQQRGPFRRWWHEHSFTALDEDRTLMIDRAEFQSPLWMLGVLVDRFVLSRYMTELLRQRNAWLVAALES